MKRIIFAGILFSMMQANALDTPCEKSAIKILASDASTVASRMPASEAGPEEFKMTSEGKQIYSLLENLRQKVTFDAEATGLSYLGVTNEGELCEISIGPKGEIAVTNSESGSIYAQENMTAILESRMDPSLKSIEEIITKNNEQKSGFKLMAESFYFNFNVVEKGILHELKSGSFSYKRGGFSEQTCNFKAKVVNKSWSHGETRKRMVLSPLR